MDDRERLTLREYVIACPECHAMRPHVDDAKGTWLCTCGATGDLFDYVMQAQGVEFPDALRLLGEDAGIDVERRNGGRDDGT